MRAASVTLSTLTLGACVAPPTRPPPPAPMVAKTPAPAVVPFAPPVVTPTLIAASPWEILRNRFTMADCDYRAQVVHWARRYTVNPKRFAGNLEQALPFLLLVADQIEQRNLPGEFALLPYVESRYRPLRAKGNRPAGMWQIMPMTARAIGLTISRDYDARLDALASTAAALTLLARYHDEFGDWRLADMAYNAGEYRLKHALGARDGKALSADQLAHLKLSPITIQHLDKLLAMACVIRNPARFEVTLPDADPGRALRAVDLDAGMDLRVAANLAGMDIRDVRRFNAGYRHLHSTVPPLHLMLPARRLAQFRVAADALPRTSWAEWHGEAEAGSAAASAH
ncbi:MAG: transglycosylase SLT domain-containing protein [Rhodanobacteraceae bacterium]